MNDIKVSICCLTYNHINYIEDALKGFLMQKTNFKYEVLIHDDASTDGTTQVLLEYQKKYPDIIKLSLEKENQYGKGKNYTQSLLMEAKGKYSAFCEGDDFWIYDRKLQEQYDLMEQHKEISMCYHNALIYSQMDDKIRLNVVNHPSGYICDEDIICTTKGWYPTASLFGYTALLIEQIRFTAPTSDEGYRNFMACKGKVYFFNRVWSIYRDFTGAGWNTRYYNNKELAETHFRKTILYFQEFNKYSKKRFDKYIEKRLFQGIYKYRDAHYKNKDSVDELRACIKDLKDLMEHAADDVLDAYYSLYVIQCKDYYEVMVKELDGNIDELYIYGTGIEAVKALIELDKHKMRPKGFIISDRKNQPEKLLGFPVYEIDEFLFNERKWIWPCLVNGREEVIRLLYEKKCLHILI